MATTYRIHPGIGIARLGNSRPGCDAASWTSTASAHVCSGRCAGHQSVSQTWRSKAASILRTRVGLSITRPISVSSRAERGSKLKEPTMTFDEAWTRRESFEVEQQRLPFLSRADLAANKRAAGRPKDLADLAALDGDE